MAVKGLGKVDQQYDGEYKVGKESVVLRLQLSISARILGIWILFHMS